MPVISSYAIQYTNVNVPALKSSTYDLFITEGAPLAPNGGFPAISDADVAALEAQGRSVVGYVNVSVTDDTRYYWRPEFTDNHHDTGNPDPSHAPSWLQGAVPIDFNGDHQQDALVVNFWDPAWQQIVIDQAKALVSRGYSGVFLDDVGRYLDASSQGGTGGERADEMITLVDRVRTAIQQINPAAIVVTNSDPYIVTDSPEGPTGAPAQTYRADVDIHLIENQPAATFDQFATYFPGEPLLILQTGSPAPLTYDQAWSRGILFTSDPGLSTAGSFAYPATANADVLNGGDGPNQLSGLGGDDILNGGGGNDTMNGGPGNDTFYVAQAGDVVIEASGQGNDRVAASVSYALAAGSEVERLEAITLTATDPLNLTGNEFANTIVGNNGANILSGGGGNDVLVGVGGDDILIGGAGNDRMEGGTGNDIYYAEDAGDVITERPGEGNDRVAASVSYALAAGSEVERLEAITLGATNALNLTGNAFSQTIVGNAGANILTSGGGNDSLFGLGGNDILVSGSSASAMYGGTGNDTFFVSDTSDAVFENAGEGNDRVAASVSYTLTAGAEVETLEAITQSATNALNLTGNEFGQTIIGNSGANILNGGLGIDRLIGLGGADTFAFTTTPGPTNIDRIEDFTHGTDHIALDDAVFAGIGSPGAFNANAFFAGSAAHDADDRIIYNAATGALYYDADGNGPGAMVHFADVTAGLTITATDFTVI